MHNNLQHKIMDNVLRPERLQVDTNSNTAAKEWLHWKRIFENFLIDLLNLVY